MSTGCLAIKPGGGCRWIILAICVFIGLAVWLVFGQTLRHEFVNFDDDRYVYQNPVVQKGLSWQGLGWALTFGEIGHWHPLTWLSHMLDCQIYGLNAGGHHLTNVLLHAAAAILLFLVLRQMTGALWRGAFVAVLFAVHPLRVESVAWVSERKDVLSACFFMLTLLFYVRHVQKRSKAENQKSDGSASVSAPDSRLTTLDYALALLCFALGLLSKNMLVTLPFVLLLLDWWPLQRVTSRESRVTLLRLVLEKIPFFVLSAASCVATFLVPEKVAASDRFPFGFRVENAVVAYVNYLQQMVWPAGLAVPYLPPRGGFPFWEVVFALMLLVLISLVATVLRGRHPYLVVGWLWYVGMLVPVIGLVQISYYTHADRYTYLPQIGIYIMLAWAAAEPCASRRFLRLVFGIAAVMIIAALMITAAIRTACWRDSGSLSERTLAVTENNYVAWNNLGIWLSNNGKIAEAVDCFYQALGIKPDYSDAFYNLGNAYAKSGKWDEAVENYRGALQLTPDQPDVWNNLGFALAAKKQFAEAIANLNAALQLKPDHADAHNNLAGVLFIEGRFDEAVHHYREAIRFKPDSSQLYKNLGDALARQGRTAEAAGCYTEALRLDPRDVCGAAKRLQSLHQPKPLAPGTAETETKPARN